MNKKLIILTSRGDFGYGSSERIAHMNHVEPSIRTAFGYIGIADVHSVAVEYDEYADDRLTASIAAAEAAVHGIVSQLSAAYDLRMAG
jgi:FMN-dependent NADH-azoreductase